MIIKFFERAEEEVSPAVEEPLLSAILRPDKVGKQQAMEIPAFASAIDTIAGTVASLPIKLYRKDGERVTEIKDDRRVRLLNGDTGDTLTASEMKKALIEDYYADKGGYIYINRYGNEVLSLHYVEARQVAVMKNADPIFKQYKLLVNAHEYYPFQFLRVLHNSKDGMRGTSLVEKNNGVLSVAYATMKYEETLVQRGGNKRGFVKAAKKLGDTALKQLKVAWRKFYGNNEENVIILNEGVDFQEASNTSVEMQLNENKQANGDDIYALFKIPPSIIRGGATENDRDNYIRYCAMDLLSDFKATLDRDLLLESEKGAYYFDFDLSEYMKANMKERWSAWASAKKAGLVQVDEFRAAENMAPLGIDYVNIGLQDVLYYPKQQKLVIPNMGKAVNIDDMPTGGEENESNASQ